MYFTESGAIYAFGYGAQGQLGLGVVKNASKPTAVKSFVPPQVLGFTDEPEEKVVALALGQNHSIALSCQGLVYTCGASQFGQLGRQIQEETNQTSFLRVNQLSDIISVFAGGNSSWAVRDVEVFKTQ